MQRFVTHLVFCFLFSTFLFSCAGYRLKRSDNPLDLYGISHINIPMFVNKTSLVNVSGVFTEKFVQLFSQFGDLKVTGGSSRSSDAELLGIIQSPRRLRDTVKVSGTVFTQGDLEDSIGGRSKLYVPISSSVNLSLRLILVMKNVDTSKPGQRAVIVDQVYYLNGSFSRVVNKSVSVDDGGVVNFTKSRNNMYDTISALADTGVNRFRDLIINVF